LRTNRGGRAAGRQAAGKCCAASARSLLAVRSTRSAAEIAMEPGMTFREAGAGAAGRTIAA
jgi:hypothetical protein